MHIAPIYHDTLKVETDKIPSLFVPKTQQIIARSRFGKVYLNIDGSVVEMDTTTAVRIGLALGRSQLAPDEMAVLVINGERVELLQPHALKVSAALLRKADDADDWQIRR